MTETVRCPACRGTKKVPKLGGIIGECNTCSGKGTILAVDKPVKAEAVTLEDVLSKELINAVAEVAPVNTIKIERRVALPEEPAIKVDPKRALFKRKTASK